MAISTFNPEMVLDWTKELVTRLQEDYDDSILLVKLQSLRYKLVANVTRYFKEPGVHAFLNKETGEVFKPASYKAPAKHVRYDLRRIQQRRECFANADWAGGYLYLRL